MKKVTRLFSPGLLVSGLLALGPLLVTLTSCQSLPPKDSTTEALAPAEQVVAPVVLPAKSEPYWIDVKQRELESELKALRALPSTAKNKTVLIDSLYQLGKKSVEKRHGFLAIKALKACLKQDLKNIECHWELGWAHYIEHSYQKALQQFQWVLRHQSDRDGIKLLIAKLKNLVKVQTQALTLRKHASKSIYVHLRKGEKILNISAVGDTMLGSATTPINLPPKNQSTLALISATLKKGDIIFANHEGTLCKGTISTKCQNLNGGTCYAFATPPPYIDHIKASGINLVSLANNHILDFGETCRSQTESLFSANGIPWSGRKGSVAKMDIKGIPVSFIAFHASELTNSTIDLPAARELVQREKAAKRLVLVSFHGGAEGIEALHLPTPPSNELFLGENRGNVIEFSRQMVDAGADLILGSGPHVVRGMEIYKDRLIAYSLGNFATYRLFNLWGFNGVGLILQIKLAADGRLIGGRIVPTKQIEFGVPVLDKHREALDLVRYLSSKDLGSSGLRIGLDGSFAGGSKKRSVAANESLSPGPSDDPNDNANQTEVDSPETCTDKGPSCASESSLAKATENSKANPKTDGPAFKSVAERAPAEAANSLLPGSESMRDQATTDPATTDPATTDSAITDPATSQTLMAMRPDDSNAKDFDPFATDPIAVLDNIQPVIDEDPEEYLKD